MRFLLLIAIYFSTCQIANADTSGDTNVLQGGVSENEFETRRVKRDPGAVKDPLEQAQSDDLSINSNAGQTALPRVHRIRRTPVVEMKTPTKAVATELALEDFAPISTASKGEPSVAELFAAFDSVYQHPTDSFDLGAERNSRELVLAWEKWHKQICQTIYYRNMRRNPFAGTGTATARITVRRDNTIACEITDQTGSPMLADGYASTIRSLNGNPGLTFPKQSQREEVVFDYHLIRAPNIRPGYDWKRNDYETVRQNF